MKHTNSNPRGWIWRMLAGIFPRPIERQYFKEMHDVEISLDWMTGDLRITGFKIVRANPTEEMWIKHRVRAARESGTVEDIDK
jgi:hypothetical protein